MKVIISNCGWYSSIPTWTYFVNNALSTQYKDVIGSKTSGIHSDIVVNAHLGRFYSRSLQYNNVATKTHKQDSIQENSHVFEIVFPRKLIFTAESDHYIGAMMLSTPQ